MLKADPARCRGCQTCMYACATSHGRQSGLTRSRIQVSHVLGEKGSIVLRYCRHCPIPKCITDCPTEAIRQGEDGLVRINPVLCIGCGRCRDYCPFDAIVAPAEERKSIKCDLCENRSSGDGPACVEVCPVDAITIVERKSR